MSIPDQMPGWMIALPLFTIVIIDVFLWGLDLVITEVASARPWWRVFLRSGSFWLGVRFVLWAIILPGVLGVIFLLEPDRMRPTWFGVGTIVVAGSSVAAWWLLNLTNTAEEEDES